MKLVNLIELIKQHHPHMIEEEIRHLLNRAADDLSVKSELIETLDNDKINIKILVTEAEKLYVEKKSLEQRGLTQDDLSVDVKIVSSDEIKKLISESEVILNF